ncbi:MAG: hypothetical protein ACLS3C_07280 [Oscillospiraceae bacterium]
MFVWLVNVLNGMPGGRIIGVIFFVCVLFAGLSSIINLYEAPVATLQDNLKLKRVPATAIILVIGCVIAILIQKITSGVDGRRLDLHLPARRSAGWYHVLLGRR